jgi:hypothetical protein
MSLDTITMLSMSIRGATYEKPKIWKNIFSDARSFKYL